MKHNDEELREAVKECERLAAWKWLDEGTGAKLRTVLASLEAARAEREAMWHQFLALVWVMDEHAYFRNGNTDPQGTIDEGEWRHNLVLLDLPLVEAARAEVRAAMKGTNL